MTLPSWNRPHHAPCDGEAFLFFVAFGDIDTDQPLSSSRYRSAGLPEGFQLSGYDRTAYPEVLAGFLSGPLWEGFQQAEPELAEAVFRSGRCVAVRGSLPNPPTLDYLRDTVGLLTWMLDNGGLAVYDPQAITWWSADEWREDVFAPAAPVPRAHVVVLLSAEEAAGLTWVHTRGLRKFGRPDVSVHNVPERHQDAVIELCERFIEHQALGLVLPEGQAIRLEGLPDGGVARHGGSLEDPDFNNVHVEIVWPGAGLAEL